MRLMLFGPACIFLSLLSFLTIFATSTAAQETDLKGQILIELNSTDFVEATDGGAQACTLSFLVTNGLAVDLDALVVETVLFDTSGSVDRLTLFDFAALPQARPRVRQFSVPDLACDGMSRILINGVQSCSGAGVDAAVCAKAITTSSRTDIEILG